MIEIISAAVLVGVACLALVLQRLYSVIPAKELKRLATRGDHLAKGLYRVAAYGRAGRLLLWTAAVGGLSGGLALLNSGLSVLLVTALLGVVLTVVLVLLPSVQLTQNTARLAVWCSPAVAWLLLHLHAPLDIAAAWISRMRTTAAHSRLYEKEDLLLFLKSQKQQADNRISDHDLELAERAISFNDKKAADIAQARDSAHLVDADEIIGPLLLDRLHKYGQSSFLVYKDAKENIVGSLAMADAVQAKHGGRVFDLVKGDLAFVHEDFSLAEVLRALQTTGQRLVAVINSFEEFVGIITLENILAELLGDGREPDECPAYENRGAIAAWTPAPVLVPELADDEPQDDPPSQPEEVAESIKES